MSVQAAQQIVYTKLVRDFSANAIAAYVEKVGDVDGQQMQCVVARVRHVLFPDGRRAGARIWMAFAPDARGPEQLETGVLGNFYSLLDGAERIAADVAASWDAPPDPLDAQRLAAIGTADEANDHDDD